MIQNTCENMEKLNMLSDETILERTSIEPWLFTIFVERYHEAFLMSAYETIANRSDAERIVTDTFSKIYTLAMQGYRTHTDTNTLCARWAHTILVDTILTYYHKHSLHTQHETILEPSHLEHLAREMSGHYIFQG